MASRGRGIGGAAALGGLLCVLAAGSATAQTRLELGIDRSALSTQPKAVQQKTLADIHALHAAWFRDGPTSGSAQGVAAFVEEVRFAKQQNLKVLMTIVQLDEDYDIPLTRNSRSWNAKPLSRINLARFSRRLQTLLSALKTAGLTVDAVEFGNEDDTSYYDADVPSGHPASPAEIRIWLRGYGAFLKTGASLVHARRNYPDAKIITFGIAHGGDPKESLSEPAKAVAELKAVDGANDLDNAAYDVDGFGTHNYPSPSDPKGGATALLRQDIWALGRARPFWITEFGFLKPTAFPNQHGETLPHGVADLLAAFADLGSRVPIGPLMFYSYNSGLADAEGRPSGMIAPGGGFVPAAQTLASQTKP